MATRTHTAYNSSDRPVIIDDAGHEIGGRDRGRVDPDHPLVTAAVEAGFLLLSEDRSHPEAAPVATDAPAPADDDSSAKGRAR